MRLTFRVTSSGDRWAQSDVAGTRNVFDGERAQEVVVEKAGSLNPQDPQSKRVFPESGAMDLSLIHI